MSKPRVFLFAAGGTGGHIFPALALAENLLEKNKNIEIHFVGTARGLETKIIPKFQFPLHLIQVGRLNNNVSFIERLITLVLLPWSFIQSLLLVYKLKPIAVIGVGGYASGPVLLAAALLRRHSFIWEPNAYPGMANRYLAPFVKRAFLVFKETGEHLKIKKVEIFGYPLRKIFSNKKIKTDFENPLKLFVFGGSQGSRAINNVLLELYKNKEFLNENLEIVHQTGKLDFKKVQEVYSQLPENLRNKIKIFEFIDDMPLFYNWADVALCRSGMGTVAELSAMGVPAIFIPLPTAADNHQFKNAKSLTDRGAAVLIHQSNFNLNQLKEHLQQWIMNKSKLKEMSKNMSEFHQPDAASKIVTSLLKDIDVDTASSMS